MSSSLAVNVAVASQSLKYLVTHAHTLLPTGVGTEANRPAWKSSRVSCRVYLRQWRSTAHAIGFARPQKEASRVSGRAEGRGQ